VGKAIASEEKKGVGTPNTHEKTGISVSVITTERCRRLPDGS